MPLLSNIVKKGLNICYLLVICGIKMSNKWGTTIKLKDKHAESIDKHVENKTLNYRSRSDFVIKSIEKELQHATIMQDLNDTGKIFYEDLFHL